MIIKLKNYNFGYKICSLTKAENRLKYLKSCGSSIAYYNEDKLTFFPEGRSLSLNCQESEVLAALSDGSILELNDGHAFVYFDRAASDNALFITNQCNSNCIMCPVADTVRKGADVTPLDTLLQICSLMPNDGHHITITGGEPFLLKKDFFVLLKYLKENLFHVEYLLLTNGRALSDRTYFEEFKQTAPAKLLIGIPIHGYNAETHDMITQTPGSFQQTVLALKHLLTTEFKIEIRIVVSKLNIEFLDKIAAFIIKELTGVYSIKFIGLEMLGSARKNQMQVWIDYKTSFKYMKEPIRELIINGFDTAIYNYPLCCVEEGYWPICEKSISDYKVRYLSECDYCRKKDACGGMFLGTYRMMEGVIKAIV